MNNRSQSPRITWIDSAKAYGIILVFYGHIVEQFMNLGGASAQLQMKLIYSFHMPLFFILSGYLAKNDKLNLRYRFATRILPCIFFNLLSLLLEVSRDVLNNQINLKHYLFDFFSIIRGYPAFNFVTWFLICLFTVETIDAILRKYLKNRREIFYACLALYLIGWLVLKRIEFFTEASGLTVNFWYIHEALIAYFFYQLGTIAHHRSLLEKPHSAAFKLSALAIAGFITLFTFNINPIRFVAMAHSSHGEPLLFTLTAISGSIFVILFSQVIPAHKNIIFIGQNTLILLGINGIFHHFINADIAKFLFLRLPDQNLPIFIASMLLTSFSITLSIPCIFLLKNFLPQVVGNPKRKGPLLSNIL